MKGIWCRVCWRERIRCSLDVVLVKRGGTNAHLLILPMCLRLIDFWITQREIKRTKIGTLRQDLEFPAVLAREDQVLRGHLLAGILYKWPCAKSTPSISGRTPKVHPR